ncbi:MAG: WD40 repeat domain-containing protein, partial [Acidimicrobiales bacterium]
SLLAALHDAAPARRRGRIFGAGALAVAATLGLGGVGLTELRAHPTGSLATMAGPATAPSPPGGGLPEPSEPAPAPPEATTSTTAAPTTTAAPLPSTTVPKPRSQRKPAPPPAPELSPPPSPAPAPVPTPLVTLTNLSGRVSAVAWSPDGGSLATVDPSGVTLWNPVNGSRLGAPIDASLGPITAVAWRPDGAGLAAAAGATVALTSTDGAKREELDTGGPALTALAFRPGGDELATLAADGASSVWRLPKGPSRSFAGIEAPGERPTALGWSADGKLLAAARKGGVTVWDATPGGGSVRAALAGDAALLNAVAWRPDGSQVAAVGGGAVQVWDPATGASLRRFPVSHKEPRQLAWRADGRVLAVAGTDAVVSLWDPATGAHRGDLPAGAADDTAGVALSWSPAGDRVAVTMGHQTVIYAIRADGTPA